MNYKKIYNQLIAKRRSLPLNSNKLYPYEVEYHHIIPIKCDGENTPRNKKYNTNGTNLIGLTLREHYVAHKLLEKIYEGTQYGYSMTCALWKMSNTRNGLSEDYINDDVYFEGELYFSQDSSPIIKPEDAFKYWWDC